MKGGRVHCRDERCSGRTVVRHDGWRRDVVGRVLKNR